MAHFIYFSPLNSVTLALLILVAQVSGVSAGQITGPVADFVILSGPLPVQYSLERSLPGHYLGLYKQGSTTEIARQGLQLVNKGIVQFPCDVIVTPGVYEVHLCNSTGHRLADSHSTFTAVWPTLNFTIPKTHIAQEEPHVLLQATYINQRIACRAQKPETSFYLEVEFSEEKSFTDLSVVHQELNVYLNDLNDVSISFRCELFDRAGYFRIALKKSENVRLGVSNAMSVSWGDNYYQLSSRQDSAFPCTEKLIINYTRPKCVVREDNIHMYATKTGRGEGELEYMYEAKTEEGASSVSFRCDDIRQYQWLHPAMAFCFRYQTVAFNEAVTDHKLFCLPANSSIGLPVDGQWSPWSGWMECSGNCEWGKQSRYRYCNSPTPANGGRFCEGGVSVEWRKCQSSCKPAVTPDPLSSGTSRPAHKVPTCWCGCILTDTSGLLIPGRQCPSSTEYQVHIVWLIQSPPDITIQLNITEFSWNLASQVLKVRDGSSFDDQLLAELKGNDDITSYSVTSSGSYLHIEFMSNDAVPVQPDLFVAKYNVIGLNKESQSPQISKIHDEEETWKTPVMIVGGLAAGVVLITVVLVAFIKCRQLHRAKLPRQNPDSSPNHVILQVQDGEYTNFGDITASTVPTVSNPRRAEGSQSNNMEVIYSEQCEGNHPTGCHNSNSRFKKNKNQNKPDNKSTHNTQVKVKERQLAEHYDNLGGTYTLPSGSRKSSGTRAYLHSTKGQSTSRDVACLQGISEDMPDLPDPYHVKPEDFLHDIDVLHNTSGDRIGKHKKELISDAQTPGYNVGTLRELTLEPQAPMHDKRKGKLKKHSAADIRMRYSISTLNRNITLESQVPIYSNGKGKDKQDGLTETQIPAHGASMLNDDIPQEPRSQVYGQGNNRHKKRKPKFSVSILNRNVTLDSQAPVYSDKKGKRKQAVASVPQTPEYDVSILNRNISLESQVSMYSDNKRCQEAAAAAQKKVTKQKRLKKRRHKAKHSDYHDPEEVDRLLDSLPVGGDVPRYAPPIDPDSSTDCVPLLEYEMTEYRALINQLSSTGSHNQSELVNTSAEVHPAPNTTPVEDISQELSPLASPSNPTLNNGQRSPCLDDGYNSLANTGSTQSNLSSHSKDAVGAPKLNRIKETSKSETSCEHSPRATKTSPQRHSAEIMQRERPDTHSPSQGISPEQPSTYRVCGGKERSWEPIIKVKDIELPHVTCPLLHSDSHNKSDVSELVDESLTAHLPLETSFNSSDSPPRDEALFTPPPTYFADAENTVLYLNNSVYSELKNNNVEGLSAVPKYITDSQSPKASTAINQSGDSPKKLETDNSITNSVYSSKLKEGPILVYGAKTRDRMTQSASTSDSYGYDDYLPPPSEDSSYPLLPQFSKDEHSSTLNV